MPWPTSLLIDSKRKDLARKQRVCVRLWLGWIAAMLWLGAALGWLFPAKVYHVMTLSIAASWLLCGFFWSREHTEALS